MKQSKMAYLGLLAVMVFAVSFPVFARGAGYHHNEYASAKDRRGFSSWHDSRQTNGHGQHARMQINRGSGFSADRTYAHPHLRATAYQPRFDHRNRQR